MSTEPEARPFTHGTYVLVDGSGYTVNAFGLAGNTVRVLLHSVRSNSAAAGEVQISCAMDDVYFALTVNQWCVRGRVTEERA